MNIFRLTLCEHHSNHYLQPVATVIKFKKAITKCCIRSLNGIQRTETTNIFSLNISLEDMLIYWNEQCIELLILLKYSNLIKYFFNLRICKVDMKLRDSLSNRKY